MATSLFLSVGESHSPPATVVYAFPFGRVLCVSHSLDIRAAVVLDALVGRLPGTVTGAAYAFPGSAAAGPGF